MAELSQAAADVYAPRTIQVWRSLLNWLTFFFQIFVQIVKGAPSLTQYLSFSSSSQFRPLPVVELPELTTLPLPSSPSAALQITGGQLFNGLVDQRLEKLTVVLDLDETLVWACETSSLPAIKRTQATEAGLKWFELECVSSDKESEGKPKVNYVTVFERPGLGRFLKELAEFADLVLFTAGLEGYARPLVDRIDVENRFRSRLYRPSTISTEYKEYVKDLSCISKEFERIVIVDNNPFSFILQPLNGIPCKSFSAAQPHDNELLGVILPLLKDLSRQKDVRPVLYERFHMPERFQQNGIPSKAWTKVG